MYGNLWKALIIAVGILIFQSLALFIIPTSEREGFRAVFHISGASIPLLSIILSIQSGVLLLSTVILLAVTFVHDILRLYTRMSSPFITAAGRDNEQNSFGGYIYYLLGVSATYFLFPLNIANTSVLVLALADPVGGVFSSENQSNSERITSFIFVFFTAVLIIGIMMGLKLAIASAFVASTLESTRLVDDNLTIPLGTSAILFLQTQNMIII